MAKGTRICKVCGKEYEYCRTWNDTNKFRYQDVACSPECGAIYFARIAASRASDNAQPEPQNDIVEDVVLEEELSSEFVRDARYDDEEAVG